MLILASIGFPVILEHERSRKLFFTDVERDSFSDRIGIVCSLPVYVDGCLVINTARDAEEGLK